MSEQSMATRAVASVEAEAAAGKYARFGRPLWRRTLLRTEAAILLAIVVLFVIARKRRSRLRLEGHEPRHNLFEVTSVTILAVGLLAFARGFAG